MTKNNENTKKFDPNEVIGKYFVLNEDPINYTTTNTIQIRVNKPFPNSFETKTNISAVRYIPAVPEKLCCFFQIYRSCSIPTANLP